MLIVVLLAVSVGLALIMLQVRSPMLFAIGMYLPLETTFAMFVGGMLRWATDKLRDRRNCNDAQKARVENAGVLTASGLIAGEAMAGLAIAAYRFYYAGAELENAEGVRRGLAHRAVAGRGDARGAGDPDGADAARQRGPAG